MVELTPALYKWAARIGWNFCSVPRLKDDCAQIARITLWRVSQRFDGGGEFKAYMWKAIRYRVLDFLRKKVFGKSPDCSHLAKLRKFEFTHSLDAPSLEGFEVSSREDLLYSLEERDLVDYLLTHCNPREEHIVRSRMEGRSFREIGRELGVTGSYIQQVWKVLLVKLRGVVLAKSA